MKLHEIPGCISDAVLHVVFIPVHVAIIAAVESFDPINLYHVIEAKVTK